MQNPLENKHFLVIDDFGDMRSMLRSMLNLFGVTLIDTAGNGKEAINKIEHNKYDVILCDYNLGPGKDGQQILEEARHRRLISLGAVFIMITAEHKQEMVLGAIEYEPDSYLSKPFSKDLLRSRIEKLLAKKQNLESVDRALERSDYERAIKQLDQLMARKPKNLAELTRLKADLCYRAGHFDDAAAIFERVLAVREIPWAKLGLGKIRFGKKNFVEAQELFKDLIYENKCMTAAYDWLAKTHQALGELVEAQDVLTTALELSPKAILRQKTLGEIALQNKDYECAEQAFNQAVTLGRNSVYKHPSLYAQLIESKISNEDGPKTDSALEIVRQMEQEFGKDREAQIYAAISEAAVQQTMGHAEDASACLERACRDVDRLGIHGNAELTLAVAKAAARVGEKEKAEAMLHQLIRNNHADEVILQDVENALLDSGLSDSPGQVIEDIKREIIELNNRGVKLATTGQITEAIGLFEQAAEGMMSSNKVINLNAAKVLIMRMEQQGLDQESLSKARKFIERTRRLDPDDSALARVVDKFRRLVANS